MIVLSPVSPLSPRHIGASLAAIALVAFAPAALGQANVAHAPTVAAELNQLLDSMERSVLAAEIEGYLSHIDNADAVFAQEQENWAADLKKHAPETFELELGEPEIALDAQSAVAELTMTWNLPDKKRRQVTYPVRFTHSEDNPTEWKYAGEYWAQSEGDHALALYPEGLDNHGEVVIDVWPDVRSSVNARFGVKDEDEFSSNVQQVKLYNSMAHLQSSIFLSYADVHGPLGGWNEPGEAIKAMARGRPSSGRLKTLLSHEYGHVCTFVMGPKSTKMPWWLLEGLAEFASEPFASTRRQSTDAMARRAANDSFAPWDKIADFENTPREYYGIVYRQGHHMVMFVTDTFGDEKCLAWAKTMAQGQTVDEATQAIFEISFEELDEMWRNSLKDDG